MLGMFVLSFFIGLLIWCVGVLLVMVVGVLFNFGCVVVVLFG